MGRVGVIKMVRQCQTGIDNLNSSAIYEKHV